MARLLVIARVGDRRGEVVAVKPDDHVWGSKEVPPRFEQVDVPSISPERLADLLEPDLVLDVESGDLQLAARRKLKITDIDGAKTARSETQLRTRVGAYR